MQNAVCIKIITKKVLKKSFHGKFKTTLRDFSQERHAVVCSCCIKLRNSRISRETERSTQQESNCDFLEHVQYFSSSAYSYLIYHDLQLHVVMINHIYIIHFLDLAKMPRPGKTPAESFPTFYDSLLAACAQAPLMQQPLGLTAWLIPAAHVAGNRRLSTICPHTIPARLHSDKYVRRAKKAGSKENKHASGTNQPHHCERLCLRGQKNTPW